MRRECDSGTLNVVHVHVRNSVGTILIPRGALSTIRKHHLSEHAPLCHRGAASFQLHASAPTSNCCRNVFISLNCATKSLVLYSSYRNMHGQCIIPSCSSSKQHEPRVVHIVHTRTNSALVPDQQQRRCCGMMAHHRLASRPQCVVPHMLHATASRALVRPDTDTQDTPDSAPIVPVSVSFAVPEPLPLPEQPPTRHVDEHTSLVDTTHACGSHQRSTNLSLLQHIELLLDESQQFLERLRKNMSPSPMHCTSRAVWVCPTLFFGSRASPRRVYSCAFAKEPLTLWALPARKHALTLPGHRLSAFSHASVTLSHCFRACGAHVAQVTAQTH